MRSEKLVPHSEQWAVCDCMDEVAVQEYTAKCCTFVKAFTALSLPPVTHFPESAGQDVVFERMVAFNSRGVRFGFVD